MVAALFSFLLAVGVAFPQHVVIASSGSAQKVDAPDAVDRLGQFATVDTPPANATAGIDWVNRVTKGHKVEITGRVTRTTNSGVEAVPRLRLFLVPVNDYTAWLTMHALYNAKGGHSVRYSTQFDDHFFMRTAYSDYSGKFVFPDLNPGKYYLFAAAVVTYGKAVPKDKVVDGSDAQGNSVKVRIPHLDMSDANLEVYTYIDIFELKGEGVVDLGDLPELQRVKEYQPGDYAPIEPGDGELRTITNYFLPAGQTPTAAELRPYQGSGTGSITGRLNARFKGTTNMTYYHGYNVFLLPDVQWAHAFSYSVGGQALQDGAVILPFPAWTKSVIHYAKSDQNGYFRFDNLPAGRYVIASYIDAVFTGSYSYTTGSSYLQYGITGYKYESGPYTSNDVTPEYGYTPVDTTAVTQVNTECDIYGALAALVDVAPAGVTNASLAILGSSSVGACTAQ